MPVMPRRRRRSKSAPATVNRQPRPFSKRKQWTDVSMLAAMEAVRKGTVSINKAALLHGVPCTTLKDRLSGRVVHGTNPGPRRYLDVEEESALADHLVEVAKVGYGKTRKQVKTIVESVAREKDILRSRRLSDGWWRRFLERQPQLSLRRGDSTAHVRMDSVNKDVIERYYNLLEETLLEQDLMSSPAQIYNMDESGIPLDPRPPNVIAKRGQKKVRYRVSGKKDQITVLGCANAVGQAIPPMVIFEGKYLNYQWTIGEFPGTYYGMSGKGWTDQELFGHWLKDHFLKYAVPGQPLLLILDGHSSHYEPASVELARKEGVIIFCLPPHTTQDSQPLDCTVFGPLKRHWSDVCHDFQQSNPGMVISKFNFSRLFAEAWLKALTPVNIVSGFRKCGIYPFNRDAIPLSEEGSGSPSGSSAQGPPSSTSALDPPSGSSAQGPPSGSSPLDPPPGSSALDPPSGSPSLDPPSGSSAQGPPSGSSVVSTPSRSNSQASEKKVSPVAKYLHIPTAVKSKTPVASTKTRAVTAARVLTSSQCLAIIKEKAAKKKLEDEEKEKRKKEREAKKKQREEKQRKSRERANKAEERAWKAKGREEVRAKKNQKKGARKAAESGRKRQRENCPRDTGTDSGPGPSTQTRGLRGIAAKRPRLEETISSDTCCVCTQAFEEDVQDGSGVDWIQCACTRWLHEDCIMDCIVDDNGKDRLCPFCT